MSLLGGIPKEVADTALRFLADGMPLRDAIRAGHAIMDEPLSPLAADLLKRDTRAIGAARSYNPTGDPETHAETLASNMPYDLADFRAGQRLGMEGISHPGWAPQWHQESIRIGAARRRALSHLLDAAAGGDPAVRELVAKQAGLEWLL